ncbi:MAG: sugar transporter substrate-binding protein [Solirubrobacterales bacterium]|nr:sugar transporter substrate-binding protein [Solirubrobacterales bacterium]
MTRRLAAACLLAVVVLGCGGTRGRVPDPRHVEDLTSVIKGLDNPFFATMRDGLVATAHRRGASITVRAATGLQDTAGQASKLESLASRPAGCYVVNPIDATNLIQPLAHVRSGTPIVNIDSPVDTTAAKAVGVTITSYIGTDNAAAGRLAADAMARFVAPAARVAVITGIPGDATSGARAKGFVTSARGRFDVVEAIAADFDRRRARLAAADLLRHAPVEGFFAVNDQMALGIADAVRAAGRTGKVAVIGMDGIREALAGVKRRDLSATVAQYPYTIGQLGVEACLATLRGHAVPATVDAPVKVITAQNVERAQARFPHPVEAFDDPFAALLGR